MKFILICSLLVSSLALAKNHGGKKHDKKPNIESRKAIVKECLQETGIQPRGNGKRPSEEERQKMKECLESKGLKKNKDKKAKQSKKPEVEEVE